MSSKQETGGRGARPAEGSETPTTAAAGEASRTEPVKARRRGGVAGGAQLADRPKRIPPRPIDEILGRPSAGAPEADAASGPVWDPERLKRFLTGQITLGDLEGITKQEQYEIAKTGYSYLTNGKLDQAKTVFEGLLALDPYDAYYHTALGSIAQQQGQLEEADRRYSRALELNPFSVVALANRGEIRVQTGRIAEGAQDLLRALEEDPKGTQPSTVRARATVEAVREQLARRDPKAGGASEAKTEAKAGAAEAKAPAAPAARPKAASPSPKAASPASSPKKK